MVSQEGARHPTPYATFCSASFYGTRNGVKAHKILCMKHPSMFWNNSPRPLSQSQSLNYLSVKYKIKSRHLETLEPDFLYLKLYLAFFPEDEKQAGEQV